MHHLVFVEFKTHQPRAHLLFHVLIKFSHVVVDLHKRLIFSNYGLFWVRVVVNSRLGHNVHQCGILNRLAELHDRTFILLVLVFEEYFQTWGLNV